MNEELKNLKRHIKKKDRRIAYLKRELENKNNYIKELEEIEENKLILLLRHFKEEDIVYFDYCTGLNEENLLESHICVKRKYKGLQELEDK